MFSTEDELFFEELDIASEEMLGIEFL